MLSQQTSIWSSSIFTQYRVQHEELSVLYIAILLTNAEAYFDVSDLNIN